MADKPKTILVMRHAEKPEDSSDPDLSRAGHVRRQVRQLCKSASVALPRSRGWARLARPSRGFVQ